MPATGAEAVWHGGCLTYWREGLRVLETRQVTGWGLGITEIGRTAIFSPRNKEYGYQGTLRRQFGTVPDR